jgi:two-component system phosphate regulon sensor histidine kinase PhoR
LRLTVDAHDIGKPLRWNAPLREANVLNRAFSEYVEAIHKLARELKAEHERLLAVLNRLDEGILLLSVEGRVTTANPAARELIPCVLYASDWEGRLFREVTGHAGLREFAASAGNPERPPFFQVERGHDSPKDLLCHLRALGDASGDYLMTIADVSDFRNLDRAKSDFVANASHELKTPLSSILGYSESLLEGAWEKPDTRESFVRKIHDNALRLQRLVQDLLSLSQLESPQSPYLMESLPVRIYLNAAVQFVRNDMESLGIRFENHVPPDLRFLMEPKDLELICNNLIGNAVRYNLSGGKVKVTWSRENHRLSVMDTGIGIPEDMLPRIFERFYRAGASRARKDGTGLGLAIVKHSAQRYGMTVGVSSRMGEGSEFTVDVPGEAVSYLPQSIS